MNRSQVINMQGSGLLVAGVCLLGLVLIAPDAAQHHPFDFFKLAAATSWHRPFELSAAWCSLKIILTSFGLFMVTEALGSMLARLKHEEMASAVFSLEIVSVVVFIMGNYYLAKALL